MNGKFLDSDGYTEIFAKDFGNIIAASTFAKKLFIQNNKTLETGIVTGKIIQFSDSDGYSMLKWGLCPDTIMPPINMSITPAPSGNLTTGKTYYYKVTSRNSLGESTGGFEVSQAVTGIGNSKAELSWDEVPAVTGYGIYRSETQDYTENALLHITPAPTGSFVDDGTLTPAASGIPIENTTAGGAPDYGTAPTLSADDLAIGILQSMEMKAIWIGVESELSTLETDNPRNAILEFPES